MTRNQAINYIHGAGSRQSIRGKVYNAVADEYASTLHQIQQHVGAPMSTISGRLSELLDAGLVYELPWDPGKFIATPLDDPERIKAHAADRERKRYEKWLKLGREAGYIERLYNGLKTSDNA